MMGFLLHLFFRIRALRTPNGFDFLHSLLHRWLREERALFEFLQDARPLIFFLESLESTVDRFIFIDNYADQKQSPPRICTKINCSNLLCRQVLDQTTRPELFERHQDGSSAARSFFLRSNLSHIVPVGMVNQFSDRIASFR